jgi:hypothetical protein
LLPGKFTINADFLTAACARDSDAVGVFFIEVALISSPKPGIFFSVTRSVASGVTSRAEIPVPPVVTTRWNPSSTHRVIALAMASISSGTTIGSLATS